MRPIPPAAPDRSRESFAAVGGFMAGLQLARLIDLKVWGAGAENILFFLGRAPGETLRVHLFHLVFIPAVVIGWTSLCRRLAGARFWAVNAAASWPLALFFLHSPLWTFAGLALAAGLSRKPKTLFPGFFARWPAVAVAVVFYYFWNFPGWGPPFEIDLYHEGVQLGPAMDFLAGKTPFTDIFVPQGLIHNVLKTAAAFRLFGESIAAKRFLDALAWPLGFVGMAVLGRIALKNSLSWLALLVILPLTFNYFPDRQFLACLSLAALAAGGNFVFLAGGLAGWQVWESLEVGLYCVAAGTLSLLLTAPTRRKALLRYAGGLLALSLPFIAYLLWKGAFVEFLRQSYLRCAGHQASEGLRYHALKISPRPLAKDPAWLWYLPLLVQYGAAALLALKWKRWRGEDLSAGLLLTLAAILFFYSPLSRGDFENLSFSAPYSLLLGIWLIERALAEKAYAALVLSLLVPLAAMLGSALAWGTKLRLKTDAMSANAASLAGRGPRAYGRLEGLRLEPQSAELLRKIKELYPAGSPMLPLVGESGLLFLSERRGVSRYYLPDYISVGGVEAEILGQLELAAGPVILTHRDLNRLADREGRPFAQLRRYLRDRCKPVWSTELYTLWKKAS